MRMACPAGVSNPKQSPASRASLLRGRKPAPCGFVNLTPKPANFVGAHISREKLSRPSSKPRGNVTASSSPASSANVRRRDCSSARRRHHSPRAALALLSRPRSAIPPGRLPRGCLIRIVQQHLFSTPRMRHRGTHALEPFQQAGLSPLVYVPRSRSTPLISTCFCGLDTSRRLLLRCFEPLGCAFVPRGGVRTRRPSRTRQEIRPREIFGPRTNNRTNAREGQGIFTMAG